MDSTNHAPSLGAAHAQVAARSDPLGHRVDEINHSPASKPSETVTEQISTTSSFTAPAAVGKVIMTLPDPYLLKPVSSLFEMAISGSAVEQSATTEALSANLPNTTEEIAVSSELADATGAIELTVRYEEVKEPTQPNVQDDLPIPNSDAPIPVFGETRSTIEMDASRAQGVGIGWLLSRARSLIEDGDISGARLILERAVDTGDKRAAFFLAETYDPRVLATWKAFGIKGDVSRARALYIQASEGGVPGSRERLTDLR